MQEATNGVVSREYVTDETGRIVKVCDPSCASPTTSYLVTWNGHGDALALWRTNADGSLTLANSYTYSTWGAPVTTVAGGFTDLGFRFLYVGASDVQWDNAFGLGLLYMHARHYSPSLGRFLQPDPAQEESNLYGYAGNGPITQSDPSGEWPWDGLVRLIRASNELERRHCFGHLGACYGWAIASWYATSEATRRFSDRFNHGRQDAMRHCTWQCILAYMFGPIEARVWAGLHENGDPNNAPQSRWMDQWNNAVGRSLRSAIPSHSPPEVMLAMASDLCRAAVYNGRLRIIVAGRIVSSHLEMRTRY